METLASCWLLHLRLTLSPSLHSLPVILSLYSLYCVAASPIVTVTAPQMPFSSRPLHDGLPLLLPPQVFCASGVLEYAMTVCRPEASACLPWDAASEVLLAAIDLGLNVQSEAHRSGDSLGADVAVSLLTRTFLDYTRIMRANPRHKAKDVVCLLEQKRLLLWFNSRILALGDGKVATAVVEVLLRGITEDAGPRNGTMVECVLGISSAQATEVCTALLSAGFSDYCDMLPVICDCSWGVVCQWNAPNKGLMEVRLCVHH
jgi:hypothetical protein